MADLGTCKVEVTLCATDYCGYCILKGIGVMLLQQILINYMLSSPGNSSKSAE